MSSYKTKQVKSKTSVDSSQLSLFAPVWTDALVTVAPELVPLIEAAETARRGDARRGFAESLFFRLLAEPAPTGEISRIRANLTAIALSKSLSECHQQPTPDQTRQLAAFSGWGSLAAIWDDAAHAASEPNQPETEWPQELRNWHQKYKSLRQQADTLLSNIERERAAQSSLNAYFTSIPVCEGMWELIQQTGFSGGRILEPAAGTGHFIGTMPETIRQVSRLTAVEKDPLSAAILSQLYPDVTTHATGLEIAPLQRESFDLIIGNVPFGEYSVFDAADRDLSQYPIHNYFIGKAARLVTEGGLVCLITSMGTLDAHSKTFRLRLDEEGIELLGAIRLPSCTFEKTASTEVTTDIVLFQKRPQHVARTGQAQAFVNTATLKSWPVDENEPERIAPSIEVNQYYVENPDYLLGEMNFASDVGKGGLYRGDRQTLFLSDPRQLSARLQEAVTKVGQTLTHTATRFSPVATDKPAIGVPVRPAIPTIDGTIRIKGRLWSKQSIHRSYLTLKRLFFDLLTAERTQSDEECTVLRQELQDHYSFFVGTYGQLTANRAVSWLESVDGQFLSVQALERQTVDQAGKPVVVPSAILRQRVFGVVNKPTHVDSIADGLTLSLFEYGRIKTGYISRLTGKSIEEVRTYLLSHSAEGGPLAFADPDQRGNLIEARTYLSGNIREKLARLDGRLVDEPELIVNADALQAVLPPSLPISLIHFQLGANWLPIECITDWIQTTLGMRIDLTYSTRRAEYSLSNRSGYSATNEAQGTKERTALDLIEAALNQRSIVITKSITDESGTKREIKDIDAMIAAVQQQEQLQEQFIDWAREHYAPAIETAFNDSFNNSVERQYAKPIVTHYPGAAAHITLRDHQLRAVERFKVENGMVAHWVGTGKTWVMISTAMELIRLGQVSKVMIAVQNSTVDDFARAWRELYPGAIVYQPDKADLEAKNRKRFLQANSDQSIRWYCDTPVFLKVDTR